MATSFSKADPEACRIRDEIMAKHHPRLVGAGVTVSLVMASNDNGEAVKLHGYRCAAVVGCNSTKDRIEGKADATIAIDAQWWKHAKAAERAAVVDHELTHLLVERGPDRITKDPTEIPEVFREIREPSYKTDDAGRPKLKLRLHDWQLGGFAEIVERHGDSAVEQQAFRDTAKRYEQLLLPWG